MDGRQPKRKFHEHQASRLQQQIDELTSREKLSAERIKRHAEENAALSADLARTKADVGKLRRLVEEAVSQLSR